MNLSGATRNDLCQNPKLQTLKPSLTSLYGYNAGFLDLFGRTVDLDGFPETGPRPRSKDAHLSHVCIHYCALALCTYPVSKQATHLGTEHDFKACQMCLGNVYPLLDCRTVA